VLDAAHLVDFKVKKLEYEVLAKIKDKVSFSFVTASQNQNLDPEELIGKKVTCMVPPRGALTNSKFADKRTPMLDATGMIGFELADNTVYDGYIAALENSWAFKD
jgi:uncharacterized protein involved in type VI secretion and phage assembly